MTKTLIPAPDRIIAVPTKASDKTASGLLLPAGTEHKTTTAKVVSVGELCHSAVPGDIVVHIEYGPEKYELDGTEYLLMRDDEVLALEVERG